MSIQEEEFLKALQEDPTLTAKLKKQEEFQAFKDKYNVHKASPLKCPACSAFLQFPGTLWTGNDTTRLVCRKCKLEWTLICHTIPNDELFPELKEVAKSGEGSLQWYRKIDQTKEE